MSAGAAHEAVFKAHRASLHDEQHECAGGDAVRRLELELRRRSLRRLWVLAGLGAAVGPAAILGACGGGSAGGTSAVPPPQGGTASPAPVPPPQGGTASPAPGPSAVSSASGPPKAVTLNDTLESPWGLAFLPDAGMLVTQKGGTMVILSADGASKSAPLANVPAVVDSGQGGLLDVAIDPDFGSDPWIYFSYAEADDPATAALRWHARA